MKATKFLTTSNRAIYREQGGRLYKIKGRQCIEVNIEYGMHAIIYANNTPVWPNNHAQVIRKSKFERAYREAMQKIKTFYK
jgi:hypothetical protein